MLRVMRPKSSANFAFPIFSRPATAIILGALSFTLSACSSDVSRFDFPSFGLNNSSKPVPPLAMAGKPDNGRGRPKGDYAFRPNYREDISPGASLGGNGERGGYDRSRDVASANLPTLDQPRAIEPVRRTAPDYRTYQPNRPANDYAREPQATQVQSPPVARSGKTVTVRSGDTLYGIARRNNITVAALRTANDLDGATIKPGQSLRIPGSGSQLAKAAPARQAPRASRSVTTNSGTGYTVQRGDSLYGIARRNGIKVAELLDANDISDPRSLKPGQRLVIPGASSGRTPAREVPSSNDYTRYAEAKPVTQSSPGAREPEVGSYQRTQEPRVIRSPGAQRATTKQQVPSRVALLPPPDAMSGSQFRWPAQGRIVSKFGKRNDGSHNDGINIALPQGTPIKAAENGVVAYAGNELKGYGNLVLIRHADNWVSAYAHASTISVKRGDQIRRGQVIGQVGMTGEVERPQLHFELRRGSKPVDPLKHLASN